jgi:formylglycine-generating enzyme required for sulfatase activity
VSWKDATDYAAWLGGKTGQTYRLASEAEWEYAARSGTDSFRYWGDDRANKEACRYANAADEAGKRQFKAWAPVFSCDDGFVYTAPVASFLPNSFGLYDMLGNASEWVEDCYHDSYKVAPSDGSAWTTGDCSARVLRGGSWGDDPRGLRAAYRFRLGPDNRYYFAGFRVARALTP